MKFFLFFPLFIISSWGQVKDSKMDYLNFVSSDTLKLQRTDLIIAENLAKLIKMVGKGTAPIDQIVKITRETQKSKHFQPFIPWLESVQQITKFKTSKELIPHCRQYDHKGEHFPLEKILDRIAGNFCREKTLEAISKEIEKNNTISDDSTEFIEQNLKYYLTKKNKKNFASFIQAQVSKPEILKKLSHEVTTYSVQHEIVPSQEVLKDILINEEITKLIQDKGFNIVQNQNIFYAEFGKLIEQSYKSLENKPSADKVKEQLSFLRNYLDLNQDHLPVDLCLNRLNDFAKAVFRAQFDDLARDVLKYIIKKNSKEIQEDALYFYLWTYISQNNFKEALSIAKKYDLTSSKTKIADPKLKFWIGFIYEKLDDPKEALSYYEEIISNNPLSYYAIMAVKKIQVLKPESPAVKFYAATTIKTSTPMSIDVGLLGQDYISSLIRLKAWSTIDSQRIMKLELKRLKLYSMPKFVVSLPTEKQLSARSDLHLVNARIILDSQNYLSTFKYLYEVLEKKEVLFNRSLLEILYPKPYLSELSAILKKDKLDPIIVLSLIRQESVFNPLARSRVGARGLMQIMPNTAKRIRRHIKDTHLITPKTNMEVGTTYFKGLMNRYEGNLVYVLAAYNAGEGRVDRWRGALFDSDQSILRNIESIPFLETRNYVKLIFRNIFFYKLLQEKNELTDPNELNQIYDVKLGFKH